tara:strand:+ start:2426 stop:2740 length:315 start_codon:yes stop_codon:yes gene_type:complete
MNNIEAILLFPSFFIFSIYCFQRRSRSFCLNGFRGSSETFTVGLFFSLAAFFKAILESENPETGIFTNLFLLRVVVAMIFFSFLLGISGIIFFVIEVDSFSCDW